MSVTKSGQFKISARVICAALVPAFSIFALGGCAAGNFSLTRMVGHWNDTFSPLPRALIYVLFILIPVYPITLLVDLLITNTMDFWNGQTKTASNQTFEKNGSTIAINNFFDPLRHSVITIAPKAGKIITVELRETDRKTVEVYRDGVKRAEVTNVRDALPGLLTFGRDGQTVESTRTLNVAELGVLTSSPNVALNINLVKAQLRVDSPALLACERKALRLH